LMTPKWAAGQLYKFYLTSSIYSSLQVLHYDRKRQVCCSPSCPSPSRLLTTAQGVLLR
jgi:hypothetical protein